MCHEAEVLEARRLLSVSFAKGTLSVTGTSKADQIEVFITGGPSGATARVVVNAKELWNTEGLLECSPLARVRINARAGGDQVAVSVDGTDVPVTVVGGDGADRVSSNATRSVLNGGHGNDHIEITVGPKHARRAEDVHLVGGEGDDTLLADDGPDLLVGGAGNDLLQGGSFDDTLAGGEGDDRMYGAYFSADGTVLSHETLGGSLDNDTLFGGSGNDYLEAGWGTDEFYGGEGDDDINHFEPGIASYDTVIDREYVNGGPGRDKGLRRHSAVCGPINDRLVSVENIDLITSGLC